MFIKGLTPSRMTPAERAKGRFMRAPDGHDDGDEGVDNEDENEDDDDQSGEADDDTDANEDDDSDSNDEDADSDDEGSRRDARGKSAPKNGYERRIAKLTREVAQLRKENGGQDDASGRAAEPPKKPVVTDFDTYEDFVEALTDFKADQLISKRLSENEQRNAARNADNEFQKALNAGKKAYKDWDDVVTEDVEVTPSMLRAIKDTDNPADVAYYLGSNTDEAERIAALPAGKQANAIAKIDARFDGKQKDKGKTTLRQVSSAPEPIRPNKGPGGKVTKDYEKMSADEFMRTRNAELRQRKG